MAETVRRAGEFGVSVDGWRLDYPRVVGRARELVAGFSGEGPRESLAGQGVTLLDGSVRFVGPREVECDGQRYEAERFVIASGSISQVPELPGLGNVPYLTSDQRPGHLAG